MQSAGPASCQSRRRRGPLTLSESEPRLTVFLDHHTLHLWIAPDLTHVSFNGLSFPIGRYGTHLHHPHSSVSRDRGNQLRPVPVRRRSEFVSVNLVQTLSTVGCELHKRLHFP